MHLGLSSQRAARSHAVGLGGRLRDARLASRWSQAALADRVGTSQPTISRLEAGQTDAFDLELALAVADELGVRLNIAATSPLFSERRDTKDLVHARCIVYGSRRIREDAFETDEEVEVGEGRWRGWIDILAFHPVAEALLVQEVKTEIHDAGEEQRRLARYEHDAWRAARAHGWHPRVVHSGILLLATQRNDERVAELRDWANEALPVRAGALQAWLRDPAGPWPGGRSLAMIDPYARRADWLRPLRLDGRRTPAPYRDYADIAQRMRRSARCPGMRRAAYAPPE